MDSVRHVLAVVLVVTLPPGVVYWFLIHPFVGFWRKLGPAVTYMIMIPVLLAMMLAMFLIRDLLLFGDLGTKYVLLVPAVVTYAASVYVGVRARNYLSFRIFLGVPELAPGGTGGKLLTEGIYGQMRHPRYVAVILGTVGFALFINYLAVYMLFAASIAALYLLTLIEERELIGRFGEEYLRYRERVPRFIPGSAP